jgi:class 3 adenylate cyclase
VQTSATQPLCRFFVAVEPLRPFTDIVGSTAKAAEVGDAGWRELLERHHRLIRRQLARARGKEVDTAGDGFFAAFDGPARATGARARSPSP